jgi:DNA topoisomerase-2
MAKVRQVKQISQLQHAKNKSMWVGSKNIQTIEVYVPVGEIGSIEKFILKKIKFAPAWYKIIDEIIVNAIDQWVNYPKLVSEIRISFNIETGVVTIYNSGPSIGIYETKNLNGEKMYAPQLIAAEFLSGDNLDEDGDDERITGGTNGAGLKLTNAFSDYLILTTVDTKVKKHYSQTFKDRLNIIEKPIIRKTTSAEKTSFTQIEFLPSYKVFGYKNGYTKSIYEDLEKLIITRSYQAAGFTSATIYYNNVEIVMSSNNSLESLPQVCEFSVKKKGQKKATEKVLKSQTNTFINFSQMFLQYPDYGMWHTKLTSTDKSLKKFPWDVCIGISDGKFRQMSLINGIYVQNGGSHIKYIQDQVVENLKKRVEKLIKKSKTNFNPNFITNNLFIFVRGSIIKPQFSSQIKFTLNDPVEKFESYKFKSKDWVDIWNMMEIHIMSMFLDKYKDKKKNRVTRGAVNVPKCIDAKFAGDKTKGKKCTLIICEGDSAMGTVHEGITSKHTKLDYDYYGTFSIQGVPMNARKEISTYVDEKTKKQTIIRTSKLQKNERLSSLVKVLGLDYEKTYELTPDGDKEFESIRYGKTTGAVDQDHDGKGNIFGLYINFIILFWPALAKRGFITRFNTPIIRAYPKSKKSYVEEFESLKTYESWVESKFDGDEENVCKSYTLKYYKGLGSHKKQEIPQMFKNFEKRLCIYELDSQALQKLEVYFGNNTDLRKEALSTPVSREETIGNLIDITEQLDRDLKAYQRDNIMRKLPHLMDGAVPSRRKVIYTARNVFAGMNHEMKVSLFVGETSKFTHYHHGETSLAGTITKMAQDFPGSRNLPFLKPCGQFGTRSNGGKDAASPRYTFTKLNKELCMSMFPSDDDFLLKYTFDDGVRCEPEFYAPIVPLSILENMEIPATGWKVKLWARDFNEVITNVRKLIIGKLKKSKSMSVWLNGNKGDIRTRNGKTYAVGKYTYYEKKNQIIVTELPLGTYSSSFIGEFGSDNTRHLCNKPQFKDKPKDATNTDEVNITFNLTKTGWEEISKNHGNETFDCVEDFMNLKTSLDSNINMIGVDGTVCEFKKYEHVIDQWFPVRKQLYADRIERKIILTNLMIIYLQNIIKFTKAHQSYKITPKTTIEQVNKILIKNKFDRFNSGLLNNPKYTAVAELPGLVMSTYNGDDIASITYDYLIRLSYRDMVKSSCDKREKLLADYQKKLLDLQDDNGEDGSFPGQKTWLSELDELERLVKLGTKLGWDYGNDSHIKFRS